MIITKKQVLFDPYIPTEETIFKLLERDKDLISDDYELFVYPLAYWINNYGVQKTNELIRNTKSDKKRVFVCQHISVDKLNFRHNDIVATPHASTRDNFISIPHYSVNYDLSKCEKDRKILFSFIGSTQTHNTRKIIVQNFNTCYDSKVYWGFEKKNDKSFIDNYNKLNGDTDFGVCPRGTGISSVRLFETMAMGCIPVIIADNYKAPVSDKINWSDFSLSVSENNISNLENIIKDNEVNKDIMRKKMKIVYDKYLSNENLHQAILEKLKIK